MVTSQSHHHLLQNEIRGKNYRKNFREELKCTCPFFFYLIKIEWAFIIFVKTENYYAENNTFY